jgi:methyltransferase (TIGR00027 family)
MKEKNMTALVSSFVKAYHYKHYKQKVFSDNLASRILTEEEYEGIAMNMSNGISYFNPSFKGTSEEALRWVVDNQLSPSVIGRSAFCETALLESMSLGCSQYMIYASGYDSFAYRNNNIRVFEIDREEMIEDKKKRVMRNQLDASNVEYVACDFTDKNWVHTILESNYDKDKLSFSSLLGISYYLTSAEFETMIHNISKIISPESLLVFDYPTYDSGYESNINEELAEASNEQMKSKYSYKDMERILLDNDLSIVKHLNDTKMTSTFFKTYNSFNPDNEIKAPKGVSYCLAIKK